MVAQNLMYISQPPLKADVAIWQNSVNRWKKCKVKSNVFQGSSAPFFNVSSFPWDESWGTKLDYQDAGQNAEKAGL